MNIPLRIRNLIKRHDTNDPYKIAKELGITVMAVELPERTYGIFKRVLGRKYVLVNDSLPEGIQRFIVAHELGHVLMHPGYSYYRMENRGYYASTMKEEEADQFALMLLKGQLNFNNQC